ncbi:MAG: hypothetical protein JKY01_10340 [Pseudomonadales bacterium]|nr:hypothetical protein [Pseudomonadales bacterium]
MPHLLYLLITQIGALKEINISVRLFGVVRAGGSPIVYLEGAFTRLTGNTGKQWLCAQTFIHELSHHGISTQNHCYDPHGLKPNKASFLYAKAIQNADSWG